MNQFKVYSYYTLLTATVVAVLIGVWARLVNLGFPADQIFDEVYFPVFANNYLTNVSVFDVHPPLGKFIIAVGIWLFGDSPFGWRIMPALFGIGIIAIGAAAAWLMFKSKVATLLTTLFLASETILIVYSRTGLMDGIHLFFILLTFWTALRAKDKRDILWIALALGAAVSIKWVALGVIIPVTYLMWQKKLLKPFLQSLALSAFLYIIVVYAGQVMNGVEHPLKETWEWHKQAYEYHAHLTATHPWSSVWYTWPLMLRPVLFYNSLDANGNTLFMNTIGNPILWWSSTVAVIVSILELIRVAVQERSKFIEHPLVVLVLGYAAFLLPWIPIHRVVFIYHYLPCYAFALFMLVYWLRRLWSFNQVVVAVYAIIILGIFWYFLPLVMASPITNEVLQQHLWLKSWL